MHYVDIILRKAIRHRPKGPKGGQFMPKDEAAGQSGDLTPDEKFALRDYGGGLANPVNARLRGREISGEEGIKLRPAVADMHIARIDSAFEKAKSPVTQTLYRGTGPGHFGIKGSIKVGQVLTDKGVCDAD